jgi:hypothetical protein
MINQDVWSFAERCVDCEDAEDCYVRIRIGKTHNGAKVVASKIALGGSLNDLASELESRMVSLDTHSGERVFIERMAHGSSKIRDSVITDGPGQVEELGNHHTESLAVMANALVRMSEGANQRANSAQSETSKLFERIVALQGEASMLEALIASADPDKEFNIWERLADAFEPLIPVVAAGFAAKQDAVPAVPPTEQIEDESPRQAVPLVEEKEQSTHPQDG